MTINTNLFVNWQPHLQAVACYWQQHKLWEQQVLDFVQFHQQHGKALHAAVRAAGAAWPAVLTQADVCFGMFTLHRTYAYVMGKGPAVGAGHKRQDTHFAVFRNGLVLAGLLDGEVFLASGESGSGGSSGVGHWAMLGGQVAAGATTGGAVAAVGGGSVSGGSFVGTGEVPRWRTVAVVSE
eukprot:gene3742-4003_t